MDYFGGAIIYFIFVSMLMFLLIHSAAICFYRIYKSNKIRLLLIFGGILVSYIIVLVELKKTCDDWDNGIAGYLETDVGECNLL